MMSQNKLINYVALVVDSSGSMHPYRSQVPKETAKQLEDLRKASEDNGQTTFVSLYDFDSHVTCRVNREQVATAKPSYFMPGGSTALLDAIGEAINDLSKAPGADHEDVSFLVIVLTDGEENTSRMHSRGDIARLMQAKIATDRWTFAAICPARAERLLRNIGFASGNIQIWDETKGEVEYERQSQVTRGATVSYIVDRSSGVKAKTTFFTDLSNVSQSQVQAAAQDVSDLYKEHTVGAESKIAEFVQKKIRRPYIKGDAFYLLSKTEKIQDHKEIILKDKTNGKLFGGSGARGLIGLPQFGEVRVHVGLHGQYDIFVQSTSTNRILGRGTKVLIRK